MLVKIAAAAMIISGLSVGAAHAQSFTPNVTEIGSVTNLAWPPPTPYLTKEFCEAENPWTDYCTQGEKGYWYPTYNA